MAREPVNFDGPWSRSRAPFASAGPQGAPPLRRWITACVAVFVLAGLLLGLPGYLQQWLWMRQLGYVGIFWRLLSVQWIMFAAAFAFAFLFLWINIRQAIRTGVAANRAQLQAPLPWGLQSLQQPNVQLGDRQLGVLNIGVSVITAFAFAIGFASQWDTYLRFHYGGSYGMSDPLFGLDIGFYLFHLPFYQLEQGTLVYLIAVTLIIVIVLGGLFGALRLGAGQRLVANAGAIRQVCVLLAALMALLGWGFYLDRFDLVYSTLGVVYGAGYAADHVTRVALWGMMALSAATCLLFAFGFARLPVRIMVAALLGYAGLYVLGILVIPPLVQKYFVQPNELQLETPYLKNYIAFTRSAYGLDHIQETSYPALPDVAPSELAANRDTTRNIPLWDQRPLLQTYHQTQAIRLYYQFYNVDTDRYHLTDGYHQVMLSTRELSAELPAQARTWVNERLQFTHGYGAVMSFASETEGDGIPKYILKDIPDHSDYGLAVTQPSIYFGESRPGYRIVGTDVKEFDYPKGNQDVYTSYAGAGGIPLDSFWTRLLFAWTQRDINILLTSYLNPLSRIQIRTRVHERVADIAPFLRLDGDPYPVLSEGRLYWIQDAYTLSRYFPYSEPARTAQAANRREPEVAPPAPPFGRAGPPEAASGGTQGAVPVGFSDRLNYIRNSVKVVVDMYDGTVRFYVMDSTDPILAAYRRAFPGVFQDLSQLSEDLKRHLRYPEDLFSIQADLYRTFHMTDPQVFYNREDLWQFPTERYEGQAQTMRPYYVMVRLPGSDALEFLLMTPFTPQGRDNMISWLAAKSDFPDYGKIVFYELPKEKLIYGPNQVEAMIDQNTTISQLLTLWDQRGSRVIRGKQIVTPIGNSFLYVVPLYLTAAGTRFPQLKEVIVAANDRVAMAPTLDAALADLFAHNPEKGQPSNGQPQTVGSSAGTDEQALARARSNFDQAKKALQEGNWAQFGHAMDSLERQLSPSPPNSAGGH